MMLIAILAADWGFYRTPAGKAVFFTLAFHPDLSPAGKRDPQGFTRGDGELVAPRRLTVPRKPRKDVTMQRNDPVPVTTWTIGPNAPRADTSRSAATSALSATRWRPSGPGTPRKG
jgi:hypothetical protein